MYCRFNFKICPTQNDDTCPTPWNTSLKLKHVCGFQKPDKSFCMEKHPLIEHKWQMIKKALPLPIVCTCLKNFVFKIHAFSCSTHLLVSVTYMSSSKLYEVYFPNIINHSLHHIQCIFIQVNLFSILITVFQTPGMLSRIGWTPQYQKWTSHHHLNHLSL